MLVIKDITYLDAKKLIDACINAPEGRRLEFKRVSGKMVGKALETLCAFANTDGGMLVLGLGDFKAGKNQERFLGIEENPEALDELIRKLSSHFNPFIENIRLLRGPCSSDAKPNKHLVWIIVPQSHKVHSVIDGATWGRLEASNYPLSAADITDLSYRRGTRSAESDPLSIDWGLLDTPVWRAYAVSRGFSGARSLMDQMAQLGLAAKIGQEWRPLKAAVLLFAEEPGGLLAQQGARAEVRLMVYRGRAIDSSAKPNFRKPPRTLRGPLIRLIDDTVRAVLDELAQGVELANSGFKAQHHYPERVVKEAIVNAILHRDYRLNRDILIRIFDDRLEVESPGSFPGSTTPANIRTAGSNARNPLVVKTLRDFPLPPNLDLNEGIPMMFAEMDAAHLYPPQYRQNVETTSGSVIVTLLNMERPSIWNQVSDWMDRNGSLSNSHLCHIGKMETLGASKLLRTWVEQGLLEPLPGRAKKNMAYIKTGRSIDQVGLLSSVLDNKTAT